MVFNSDEFQEKVIEFDDFEKPLLVEAGPGSGKTTVIVERIKFLLNDALINGKKVDPSSLLVITFTKKAAAQLLKKLNEELDKEIVDQMQVSTIHSFCLEFLKTRNQHYTLLANDESEKLNLFVQNNKEELGFKGIYHIQNMHISSIIDKYEEYTKFKVIDECLLKHVEKEYPISTEYVELIESLPYFSKKKVEDENLKDDWYNARFHQTVNSYRKYLCLLEENKLVDYNTLQLKAFEELEINPVTPYTNIFIDEFQDTDPLQIRIFEKLLENFDSFTAVGDMDQRIYSFRSTFKDYFKYIEEEYGAKVLPLNVNYRSCDNIIKASDSFIEHQRYSDIKKLVGNNKKYDNDCFIIRNEKPNDEALNIFNLIKNLKLKGKIENYNDVGVFFRGRNTKSLPKLLKLFDEDDIPYSSNGISVLKEKDEIKSLVTLFWYITRKIDHSYHLSDDELKWLNFKAFCGVDFEPKFWNFSEETKEYLLKIQEDFQSNVIKLENEIRKRENIKGKVSAFHRVKKNETEERLIEIFSKVDKPVVELEKITDEDDKKFFIKLEELRDLVFSNYNENKEDKLDIFSLYYELISLSDYFEDLNENEDEVNNFAALTNAISDYCSMMDETDIRGFYYFLLGVIRSQRSSHYEKNGVQLVTIHQIKGLEFPVSIVLGLEKDKFPSLSKDPERKRRTFNFKDYFYTPNECLSYKQLTVEEENEKEYEEDERVVYVAMTRAKDLLVLSSVGALPASIENIMPYLKKFDMGDLDNLTITPINKVDEKINLSYSSYKDYDLCPHRYNLKNNFKFQGPESEAALLGTVVHRILNEINKELMKNNDISEESVEKIIEEFYTIYYNIEDDEEQYENLCDDIFDYLDEFGREIKVLGTEVPFSVERDQYILNGAIDLIYQKPDGTIGILDYKNTQSKNYKFGDYREQLNIYASAIKETPQYKDISEAKIITLKSDGNADLIIDNDSISMMDKKLDDVAKNILDDNYDKTESSFCNICEFRLLCGLGK